MTGEGLGKARQPTVTIRDNQNVWERAEKLLFSAAGGVNSCVCTHMYSHIHTEEALFRDGWQKDESQWFHVVRIQIHMCTQTHVAHGGRQANHESAACPGHDAS